MKQISDSDFSLLVEKLPLLLHIAKHAVAPSDTPAANALRRLSLLQIKLKRQTLINQNRNDKE